MKTKNNTLFRLLGYIKPHWYLLAIAAVSGIIKLCLPLLLPQVMKYFTDTVLVSQIMTSSEKIKEILRCLVILTVLYMFIYIPAAYFRQAASNEVSNRITHIMRCRVYEHLQKMSAEFHRKHVSGTLVTRIDSDIEKVYDFIWNIATNVWIDGIMLFIYLIFMLKISIFLTLISGILLPVSIIITQKIRCYVREESRKVQSNVSDIAGYMQERMAGFATVRLFNAEEYEQKKFNTHSENIYRFSKRQSRFYCLGLSVTNSMTEIINSVILCLSAIYIVNNKMTVGDMLVFYTYLGYFVTPIRRFIELNANYAKSLAGIERVFEILDTPEDIKDCENAVELSTKVPMDIEFDNVCFGYDKDNVVANINFDIADGENIALVGSSGCGKTTLVTLLARFYDTTNGCVKIGGHNIKNYRLRSLYSNIGMVFQDTVLFSETIRDNIRYGDLNASDDDIISAAKAANAYEFIMNTPYGFDTQLGERGIGLSGGQRQRIAIARVFLKNPRLLILDEATSALDSESEQAVQDALSRLMKGRTSVVIAHRLSTIVNADKIIVMDKGHIVETGTHTELLKKNGRYAELYSMQFKDVLG